MKISSEKVMDHLSKLSKGRQSDDINLDEDSLAKRIHQLILNAQLNKNFEIEDDDTLFFEETEEEEEYEIAYEPLDHRGDFFTMEYIKKVLDFVERENTTFKRVNHHFRRLRDSTYLTRFRNYLAQQGTMREKLIAISKYTFEQFKQARNDGVQIHDRDVKRWAIEKARNIGHPTFKASKTWINEFKSRNRIASRKMIKFVTVTLFKDIQEIEDKAMNVTGALEGYMEENKETISLSDLFNTDESGLNYEEHGARTLFYIGEENTTAIVASMNATTHSYTIMPLISADGKVHSPALICLRESSGSFGPQVEQTISRPPNLHIRCSRSGELDKRLVRDFMDNVYAKIAGPHSVLLIDSWSGHKDETRFHLEDRILKVFHIPEGATKFMQPLDVFCFHQWKDFVKRIQERMIIDRLNIPLHQRNTIINMNAMILNQLQSELFHPMFRYAWWKSGFDVESMRFEGLKEICFESDEPSCSTEGCNKGVFMQCSWLQCRKSLCINCFLFARHYHVSSLEP